MIILLLSLWSNNHFMINEVFNERYIISSLVGSGGYSKVFLAYDKISKKHVAIKVLKCNIEENTKAYQMFKQEAMTLAAIINPNVVKVYNSNIYNNNPYIVMEYVKGRNLKSIIEENGYLLVNEVVNYMNQIIDGLEICHNANIVHRDLKPANIIKKPDGTIVILDFGTAFIKDEKVSLYQEHKGTAIGTVQYMAPELIENPEGSIQSDIYSLGIIMFEMFSGRCPYVLKDPNKKSEVLLMHREVPFPSIRTIIPSVPLSFEKIIFKCCDKNPEKRYRNLNELRIDIINAYDEYTHPKTIKKSFFKRLFKKD
ncbi:MAG: serine/threonine protein kinase [Erysipelotrichaceae bacterium]|nr:serine/threonine protein kinase [Erysipelotrichaceae bacterium]